jgi:hypothetical protein
MKTGLFAFLILAGALVVQNSARAESSDTAYSACMVKMETEQACGIWSCSDLYYSRIEGLSLVKKVDGSLSTEKDVLITTASFESKEEAQKEAHNVLRSLVAQSMCPIGALN